MWNARTAAIVLVACVISASSPARPAAAAGGWARSTGGMDQEIYRSVTRTSDGGYFIAGRTMSFGAGSSDGWCLKLDASGNPVWQRVLGAIGDDFFYSAQQTSDGGYVLVGETDANKGSYRDGWVVKLDSAGKTKWKRTFGSTSNDVFYAVQQTSDGGYIVAGYTGSRGTGFDDGWCLKLDASGKPVWQKIYGGIGTDSLFSVQQTSDGGYVAAGYSEGSAGTSFDAWCIRLDTTGTPLWRYFYGGSGVDSADHVRQTSDDGYVIAGVSDSFGAGQQDGWFAKLDTAGKIVWQKTFGGTGWERFDCVRQTSDGGYILSGYTDSYGSGNGDGWCVKVNSTGKAAWQMTYGGAGIERLYSVLQTPTGGYVAAGYTDSFGEGTPNGFAIALDGTGQIDPGCGSLVQRSKAKISGARATRSIDSSTVSAGNVKNVTAGTRFATTKATDLLVCGAADE